MHLVCCGLSWLTAKRIWKMFVWHGSVLLPGLSKGSLASSSLLLHTSSHSAGASGETSRGCLSCRVELCEFLVASPVDSPGTYASSSCCACHSALLELTLSKGSCLAQRYWLHLNRQVLHSVGTAGRVVVVMVIANHKCIISCVSVAAHLAANSRLQCLPTSAIVAVG